MKLLTKKQLEGATRCNDFNCFECSMDTQRGPYLGTCTEKVAKTALAYREMLKRLEWHYGLGYRCPVCTNYMEQGHQSDCELGQILKESEVEHDD